MTLAILGLAACAVAPPLAFTHAAVLAPDGAGLLADQTVVVRDGVIAAIGPAPAVAVPDDTRAIDATGQILVPGLVDAHVHLDSDAPVQPRPEFGDGPAFLRHGVTTVVNLRGGPRELAWRQRIACGELEGPTLLTAGEFINEPRVSTPDEVEAEVRRQVSAGYDLLKFHEIVNGRHVTTTGLSAAAYHRLNESARRLGIPLVGHAPHALGLDAALDEHQVMAHAGELLLLYALPPGRVTAMLALTALAAAVLLGSLLLAAGLRIRRGTPAIQPSIAGAALAVLAVTALVGSVPLSAGRSGLAGLVAPWAAALAIAALAAALVRRAVRVFRARATRLARATAALAAAGALLSAAAAWSWTSIAWRCSQPGLHALAVRARAADLTVISTLSVYDTMARAEAGEADAMIAAASLAPEQLADWRRAAAAPRHRWRAVLLRGFLRSSERLVGELAREGVAVVAGTDALGVPFVAPGASLLHELHLLAAAGLPAADVLRAATAAPARMLHRDGAFGRLSVGARADLLLVSYSPLERLDALDAPLGVVVRGRWYAADHHRERQAGQ